MDDLRFSANVFQTTTQLHNDDAQIFKHSEITAMKAHLSGTTNLEELGILLTMETGLRIGELATLRREDIVGHTLRIVRSEHKADFDGDFQYFVDAPKENKFRSVILTQDAQAVLERILALHDSEWLFPSENPDYDWIRSYNFDKAIRRVCRELGIKERSIHKLRKTYTSSLLSHGVSDKLVQRQLGHADIKTTHQSYYYDIYDDEEKIEILNNVRIG